MFVAQTRRKTRCAPALLLVLTMAFRSGAQEKVPAYQQQLLSPEQRAADLVSRMTLEEKVSEALNAAAGIPRQPWPNSAWKIK